MYIADLHIHSKYSRATSGDCVPELLDVWARKKGIGLVGTGDFTHPAWRAELKEKLVPAEEGLYILREDCRREGGGADAPAPRFVVTGEISTIYKKNDRVRKVHSLILLPGLEEAEAVSRRLEAVARLAEAGVFAGVLLMPVLPFLEDNVENLRAVAEAGAEAGARFVYPAFGMTLRDQQREYYYQALEKGFPGLAERYRRQYGPRYECPSPRAKALWAALEERCRALGLLCRMRDITAAYQRGYGERQLTFF